MTIQRVCKQDKNSNLQKMWDQKVLIHNKLKWMSNLVIRKLMMKWMNQYQDLK